MREMKDSGVEWIGEIPKDWEISSFKRVFSFDKGLPITKENLVEAGIPVLSYGQIHSKSNCGVRLTDDLLRFVSDEYLNTNPSSLAQLGDILFADTSEDYEGIGNCAYISTDTPIFAGYHTIITRPKDIGNPQYLAFQFQTDNWRSQLRGSASGIKVFTISQSMLKETTVIIPSSQTQHRIADYLDAKCAQIDRAIARQQEVIEKLKEYKLLKINEVLANVSENVCHLGYVGNFKNGLNFNSTTEGVVTKFLGVGDFKDQFVISSVDMLSDVITDEPIPGEYLLENNDIVFVRSNGSKELVGRSLMVKDIEVPVSFSGFCIRFRNQRQEILDPNYLLYFFRSPGFRKQLEILSNGSNINNINQVMLSKIEIRFPSLEQQARIVAFFDIFTAKLDKAISQKEQMISKLSEYKKSLIYEVVTGKREV
jgi:type I restriction enzyme S subunit